MNNPRESGSSLSKETSGFLQMAEWIRAVMQGKRLGIEGDMNLSMVDLRKPIEAVNSYIQDALQRGVNAFLT